MPLTSAFPCRPAARPSKPSSAASEPPAPRPPAHGARPRARHARQRHPRRAARRSARAPAPQLRAVDPPRRSALYRSRRARRDHAAGGAPAAAVAAPAPTRPRDPSILVAGNPNSGKSTLFNALTGAHVKVSNYPGVTVTRTTAVVSIPGFGPAELVDLPGTYSLSARSRDEQVAVDAVLGRGGTRPDAVLIVADATALARNLYFVTRGARNRRARRRRAEHDRRGAGAGHRDRRRAAVVAARRAGRADGRALAARDWPRCAARSTSALDAPRTPCAGRGPAGRRRARHRRASPRSWRARCRASHDARARLGDLDSAVARRMRRTIWPVSRRRARGGAPDARREAAANGRNLDLEIIGARYQHVDAHRRATWSGIRRSRGRRGPHALTACSRIGSGAR